MLFPLPNSRAQEESWSVQFPTSIYFSLLGLVSLSLPAPSPRRSPTRPASRCSVCYCTLSNTCWQLPGITPERGRRSSPACGAGAGAKPLRAAASIFTPEHKGNFFQKQLLIFPPFWQLKNSERGKKITVQ